MSEEENINERYRKEVESDPDRGLVGLAHKSNSEGPTIHRDPTLDRLVIDKSLTELYTNQFNRLKQLDEKAAKDLIAYLSAGVCKDYFREVAHQAIFDVLKCNFESTEDQFKLCAKYNRAMGAIELLNNLLTIGD